MKTVESRATETGGRGATTRHIPPKLALAVGMPTPPAPSGWRWTELTELARLESGHTPSRKHPEYWGGTIPWIGIKDARANHGRRIESTLERTNELGIENSSARILPENTVCLSRTASVGYVVVMARPMATSQDFVNWVCSKHLDPDFLKYLFIAEGDGLLRFSSGAVHQTIYFPEVKAFHICHPPLAEQRRIVSLLDEAFAGLANAKANAEKNLQSARALFESHLQSVFTEPGDGWVQKQLGEIAEFRNGLNYSKSSNGQTLPVVGVGDFQSNFYAPMENLQSATIDGQLRDGYAIRRNDILTVRSNGSKELVGRCMLVPEVSEVASYSGFVIRIRVNADELVPRFLLHFLKSSSTRDRLTREGGGANISNINQAKLSSLPVVVPPLKMQEEIANSLDQVSTETQRLVRLYERKLAALEALKKSLLRQAFTGELGAQAA